ncbi:MAG: hypothetical protein ABII00_16240 [Elusimicrobiota bacterium]
MLAANFLLAFSLSLSSALWGTGVISVDPGEPGAGPADVSEKRKGSRGDIQVGPAVRQAQEEPTLEPREQGPARGKPAGSPAPQSGSRVPGIFAVYEAGARWMLIERVPKGGKRLVRKGSRMVVIGSRGIDEFYAASSTRTYEAACEGFNPVPTPGYLLSAKSALNFKRVGKPIIAVILRKGSKFDASKALFYALSNEVDESVYGRLGSVIRETVIAEVDSGAFQIAVDDEEGQRFAARPDAEQMRMKIDFGSKVRYRGLREAFVLVEDVEISRSHRRCMRLFEGDKPVGACVGMPRELMSETQNLAFVAYDPSQRGTPFILAHTKKKPLWGHERWGFQLTDEGPRLFMRDALDPRCRESF